MRGKNRRQLLIVVSAPSGAGKTTLCDRLLEDFPEIVYSVSCTTREPRGSEVDGEDYFFLSEEDFDRRVAEGAFLEYAGVHARRYGTLREPVESALREGCHVLMDIDVQGAARIRRIAQAAPEGDLIRRGFVDIFIRPPSLEALRERLAERGEDAAEVIEGRLAAAREEMAHMNEYRYVVVNEVLEDAYRELTEIVCAEMNRNA
ncbi:MAG: guanylate kinase [Lentisphaerae bacterium]|nr:guanylate kinase [Lentisphaerota bacterium]